MLPSNKANQAYFLGNNYSPVASPILNVWANQNGVATWFHQGQGTGYPDGPWSTLNGLYTCIFNRRGDTSRPESLRTHTFLCRQNCFRRYYCAYWKRILTFHEEFEAELLHQEYLKFQNDSQWTEKFE